VSDAKLPKKFDVWFTAADQVYRGVPADVVRGWAEQGRLGEADRLRTAGAQSEWIKVADYTPLTGFLYRKPTFDEAGGPIELDIDAVKPRREIEDDEVDMIPLIDISLVLLVFFMMTAVVAVSSPIKVPEMKYAEEFAKDGESLTVQIDRRPDGTPFYALRLGDKGPTTEDNNLGGLPELFARLDSRLGERKEPPEVRIACHEKLPGEFVRAVTKELDRRKRNGKIRTYSADVNEAAK